MRRFRVRAGVALAALASGLALPLAAPATAEIAVSEVYPRPADGIYRIEGHGWGHGHGLNQWGTQGAAKAGVTATQIVAKYYPGTAAATLADRPIRVEIRDDERMDLQVRPESGMTVRDYATGRTYSLPTGPSRWRATASSSGLRLQHYSSGAWRLWSPYGHDNWAGPLIFESSSATRRLYLPDGSARDYRGSLAAAKVPGAVALYTLNVVGLEAYLQGVVPRESPAYWEPAALQAQSIAARSYSAFKRAHVPAGAAFDICNTTACQVYGGVRLIQADGDELPQEAASTNAAIAATRGQVRTVDGQPIFAEYSSSNGGWSTTGSFPYLAAQADPWDALASPHHRWLAELPVSAIEARYAASGLGRLERMRVVSRDGNGEWGGRVKDVVLEGRDSAGNATRVAATGGGIFFARTWPQFSNGLRGSWWHIRQTLAATVVSRTGHPTLVRPPGRAVVEAVTTVRNAGAASWAAADVHLATSSPGGAADALVGGSTRPGRFVKNLSRPGATSVAPGEQAQFAVRYDATRVARGTYRRLYRVRLGTGPLFGDPVAWTVTVVDPILTARLAGPPLPVVAPAKGAPPSVGADGVVIVPRTGKTGVTLRFTNTGNVAWPVGGAVRLGTANPLNRASASAGSGWLDPTRPTRLDARSGGTGDTTVEPGETGVFTFDIYGNNRPAGVTQEDLSALWEGVRWMSTPVRLHVVRVDTAVSRHAGTVAVVPPALTMLRYPLGTATLTVQLRNLGRDAWPVGGDDVLGTASARDRTSALRGAGWLAPNRATRLARNASRPGVTAVHPGEVGEWRVPLDATRAALGDHLEAFQALLTGVAWYGPVVSARVRVVDATFTGTLVQQPGIIPVPRAGTATMWFDVRNTGNAVWPVGGLLRSVSPYTGGSGSRHSSWLAPTRPSTAVANVTRPGATTVRPGESARFRFVLAGNNRAPGTYREVFGVVWEGYRSLPFSVTVTSTIR